MKRIAVLTSGGDAPGMNAAIRAVVRVGLDSGVEVMGIRNGYRGLLAGDCYSIGVRDVGGIIQMGGTVLGSARCREFETDEGQLKALDQLAYHRIEGVVVIGGNGSQSGAAALSRRGIPVAGVASTIDNDLFGSDITLGVNTALDVALEAIDRLKVTASSHHRAFLVEVMGRKCGYLALMAGIAGGAEVIVLPEQETEPEAVAEELRAAYDKGKGHAIVVVAEGAAFSAEKIAEHFQANRARLGFEVRVTKLGHTQRGGSPTAFDRLLGTRLGAAATECLCRGEHGILVGHVKGETATTPLAEVAGRKKPLDLRMLELARILAK